MKKVWRFFPLQTKSPETNMAFDEALFRAKINNPEMPNSFRLYRWNPSAASCGKHQDINKEIDIIEAKSRNIKVIRRITGGGAVFHENTGEITYSVVVSSDDFDENSQESLIMLLLKGLQKGFANLGLKTTYDKIHCPSLFVSGRKISGNAQARHGQVLLQHGTILIDYSPELMYSVLRARPDKPKLKMIESVYAHITTINKELKEKIGYKEVANNMLNGFKETFVNFKWIQGTIFDEEKDLITNLEKNKYLSSEWILNKNEQILFNK